MKRMILAAAATTRRNPTCRPSKNLKISANEAEQSSSDGVFTEMELRPGDARELTFGKFVIEPGVSLPAHTHAFDTMAHCVTGSCSFRIGEELDEEFEIAPGQYCYIPAGVVHTEETGVEGVELIFARDRQGGGQS
jgi:quercetin dioxygenase-like cupin family protein